MVTKSSSLIEVHERRQETLFDTKIVYEVHHLNYLYTRLDTKISAERGYTLCAKGIDSDLTLHFMGYMAVGQTV